MRYTIIWNENRSEGIVLKDRKDIAFASTGDYVDYPESTIGVSTLADAFRDVYDETLDFETQEIDIDTPQQTD